MKLNYFGKTDNNEIQNTSETQDDDTNDNETNNNETNTQMNIATFCPSCGDENEDGGVFCASCGTSLKEDQ